MNATRFIGILTIVLVVHALAYWVWVAYIAPFWEPPDAAGTVMLLALGLAMGFGGFVLVKGARDL